MLDKYALRGRFGAVAVLEYERWPEDGLDRPEERYRKRKCEPAGLGPFVIQNKIWVVVKGGRSGVQ